MRIGIDLGGTKIEGVVLDGDGSVRARLRVATPKGDYWGTINALGDLVQELERLVSNTCTVGVGMPGAISPRTGRVKNANSTWLNGQDFSTDLSRRLQREVRFANDANCLAVSEAIDGAGAGARVVFAVIIGTGCGAGLAIDGAVHQGQNGVAGEWGHNTLGWLLPEEYPGPSCYCGRRGCIETFISGSGFEYDYLQLTGVHKGGVAIMTDYQRGCEKAVQVVHRYRSRLSRALAMSINFFDPDVIVLGGGMSNIDAIYEDLLAMVEPWVLGGECQTPIRRSLHGDASGVRGAAWLW